MANITLAGTLRDPNGDLAVGDKVRFTHKSTTGETVKSASSILTIDPTGVYSVDLEYGLILVEYKDARNAQFENLGVATVNGTNPATTIPELLNALVPVSSAELIEFQAILADCVAAKDAAEAAAATLDLVNDLSQAYIFDTVALFKSSSIVFPDGKTIHLNDRDADFTKIAGTGAGNNRNIISSTSVSQSAVLNPPLSNRVIASQMGVIDDVADQTAEVQLVNELVLATYGVGFSVAYDFGVLFTPENLDFKLFNNVWMEHNEGNNSNRKVVYPNGNDGSGMEHETIVRMGYNFGSDVIDIHNDYDVDYGAGQVPSLRNTFWGCRFNGGAGWQFASDLLATNNENCGLVSNQTNKMMVSYYHSGRTRYGQRTFIDLTEPTSTNEFNKQAMVVGDDDTNLTFGMRLLQIGVGTATATVTHQKLFQLQTNGNLGISNDANTKYIFNMNDEGGIASSRYVEAATSTPLQSQYGKILTNINAGLVPILPPATVGAQLEYVVIFAQNLRIVPATGETFRGKVTGKYINSNVAGSRVKLVCVTSGGVWEIEQSGTWTDEP